MSSECHSARVLQTGAIIYTQSIGLLRAFYTPVAGTKKTARVMQAVPNSVAF